MVNPQGYVVRIKFNSAANRWEFTVGLSYVNPIKWQGEKATGVKNNRDVDPNAKAPYYRKFKAYDDLIAYEYNEIFKIVIVDELVMVTPATMQRYWLDHFAGQEQVMAKAHRRLLPIKKTTAVDEFCGF